MAEAQGIYRHQYHEEDGAEDIAVQRQVAGDTQKYRLYQALGHGIANACQRSHQSCFDAVDTAVADGRAVGLLLLHTGYDTCDGSAPVILCVIVVHMAFQGFFPLLHVVRIEPSDNRAHGVCKAESLHDFKVVTLLSEGNPEQPGFCQIIFFQLYTHFILPPSLMYT